MRDRLQKTFRDLQRAGARPRRADPRYARPIVLTIQQAVVAIVVLVATGAVLYGAGCALAGRHLATSADIRIASIARSARLDVDAMSQDDLVARLAIPRALGNVLAPLAATDPARTIIEPQGWLDGLQNRPPAVTTAERMHALGDMATALASMPEPDRNDLIKSFLGIYSATRDPSSRTIIEVVGALPRTQRNSLAESKALYPLLAAIADLPQAKQQALADGRFQLLPDDAERLRLIQSIPQLEPLAVHLINRLAGVTDPKLRQALIYVVDQIRSGSPEVLHLITLYWNRNPALMAALVTTPPTTHAR